MLMEEKGGLFISILLKLFSLNHFKYCNFAPNQIALEFLNKYKTFIYFSIVFLLFGILFSQKESLPLGVHDWGQADRLAIAKCYTEDRGFMEPATYFQQIEDGRVGCEFPILQYIIGKSVKFLGIENLLPILYRWTIWCFWMLGLWWLFLFNKNIHRLSEDLSFLSALFWSSTPVLLHYGFGFLIDIPAYALLMGVMYYVFKFHQEKEFSSLNKALILSILAAALKVSAFIYVGGLYAAWAFWILFKKDIKMLRKTWITAGIGIILGFGLLYYTYFYYILFNKDHNIIVFISWVTPLNLKDFFQVLMYALYRWHLELFSYWHYLIFVIGLLLWIRKYIMNEGALKIKIGFKTIFIGLSIVFLIVFLLLYGNQFKDHDYYNIVTFWPLFQILGMKSLREFFRIITHKYIKIISVILILFGIGISLKQAIDRSNDFYEKRKIWIFGDMDWLVKYQNSPHKDTIPENEMVAVLYENTLNVHLLFLGRKGLILSTEEMTRDELFIEQRICNQKPNFFVLKNKNLELLKARRPEWYEDWIVYFKNEDFAIYQVNKGFYKKHCDMSQR